MVSAKTGVGPIYAIRRTAAAAEVANFTPRIPGNPFLSFTGPSALGPGCRLISSQYPAGHLIPRASAAEPRARPGRWKLLTCSIRATLLIQNGILTGATAISRKVGAGSRSQYASNRTPTARFWPHQK